MAAMIYILCVLTSLVIAILLWRGYRKSGTRLLMWSSICFAGLALNNALLFYDLKVVPQMDLFLLRNVPALLGLLALIYGLVWEVEA